MNYKLTYFNIRGLAEHIRFILEYRRIPYENVFIPIENVDDYVEWHEELPILEFGENRLTQTLTISRYLGTKYNLLPSSDILIAKADEIVDIATDLRYDFKTYLKTSSDKKEVSRQYLLNVCFPKYYRLLERHVSANPGRFSVSDEPSWHDFFLASCFDIYAWKVVGEAYLDNYPALKQLKDEVMSLTAVKKYVDNRPESAPFG